MEQFDLVVTGGTLVTPAGLTDADLGIHQGRIAAIGQGLKGREVVQASGLFVLPGLVDPHVHPIHAEDYGSVSEAAIFGGVTTTLHHLYTPTEEDPISHLERAIREAEAQSLTDFAFHVRLNDIRRTGPKIAELVERRNPTFKLFLAYGGRGIMVEDDEILLAMRHARAAGATLLFHAENGRICDLLEREARESGRNDLLSYYATRPRWVEAEAVSRLLYLTRMAGARTYLVHLTCKEALQLASEAKRDGLPVYAETCPHYLLLTADDTRELGARAKMAPPLRDSADVSALWDALDKGLLDTIGSDHSAFGPDEKDAVEPDIFAAGFGVPGIETMFPLLYDRGVRTGRVPLERLVDALATRPAEILGLQGKKGKLSPGYDADFILFDPQAPFLVGDKPYRGHSYYSLYEGWQGLGVVRAVYQRGKPLMMDGELLANPGQGRFVPRSSPTPAHLP